MVSQLWADVKYHVPTGFGFSLKASGFLFQSPPVFIHRTRLGVNFSLAHKKILAVFFEQSGFLVWGAPDRHILVISIEIFRNH